MDDAKLNALGETIVAALPGAALGHSVTFNQLAISVDLSKIVDIVRVLKTDPRFRFVNVTDVTAVDYPGRENRFDVVYHFMSPVLNTRLRLSGEANETTQVPSIIGVHHNRVGKAPLMESVAKTHELASPGAFELPLDMDYNRAYHRIKRALLYAAKRLEEVF